MAPTDLPSIVRLTKELETPQYLKRDGQRKGEIKTCIPQHKMHMHKASHGYMTLSYTKKAKMFSQEKGNETYYLASNSQQLRAD